MATKKTTTQKTTTTKPRQSATTTKKTTAKSGTSRKKKTVNEEKIRETAHRIYEDRISKGLTGDPVSDWAQAEQELDSLKN